MMTFLNALQSRGCDKPLPYIFYDAEAIFIDREIARSELNGRAMSEDERDRGVEAEISLTSIADAVLVVSKADALVYQQYSHAAVRVVNHAVRATPGPASFDERSDIVIVGKMIGDRQDSPNVDSIFWYLEEVAPLLRQHHGIHVPLTIVGNTSAELRARLANENVSFTGVVDDLAAVYNRARIMVAPTRFSAGIPLKVIEAAAAGVPCAVTERIAGQLEYSDDIHARVGSDAAGFARACADLYQCGDRWRRIRDVALQDVMHRYSTQQLFASVTDALAAVNASSERKMAATFGTRKESMPMAILPHIQIQTPQARSDVLSLLPVQSAPQATSQLQREAQLA
jgi:glycosyltransferase involved in cell wall biosynthesis